MMTVLLQGN